MTFQEDWGAGEWGCGGGARVRGGGGRKVEKTGQTDTGQVESVETGDTREAIF